MCRGMRDSDFRIASGRSSGGAGERMSRSGCGLITCRRITCGRRLAAQLEFENSRDHDHGLRSVAGLEHREFQRFHAIDEQAAAEAALVLDHPVGTLGNGHQTALCALIAQKLRKACNWIGRG